MAAIEQRSSADSSLAATDPSLCLRYQQHRVLVQGAAVAEYFLFWRVSFQLNQLPEQASHELLVQERH